MLFLLLTLVLDLYICFKILPSSTVAISTNHCSSFFFPQQSIHHGKGHEVAVIMCTSLLINKAYQSQSYCTDTLFSVNINQKLMFPEKTILDHCQPIAPNCFLPTNIQLIRENLLFFICFHIVEPQISKSHEIVDWSISRCTERMSSWNFPHRCG